MLGCNPRLLSSEPLILGVPNLSSQFPHLQSQHSPAASGLTLLPHFSFLHCQVRLQVVPETLLEWRWDRKEDPPVTLHRDHERGVRCSAAVAFPEQGTGQGEQWGGVGEAWVPVLVQP